MNKAVIFYGPPGSGKGTQADLVAGVSGMLHIDTGKLLEQIVHDPSRQDDPEIQEERKNFDEGRLNSPPFVVRVLKGRVRALGEAGVGLVFSGSPRTLYEAEELIPVLEELYGKENIHVFVLDIPDAVSIKRNSSRLLCKICHAPVLAQYIPGEARQCPRCGGPLYKRTLDNPETIKVRLGEYGNRTTPIFSFMESRGYQPNRLDGTPAPFEVFLKVRKLLKHDSSQD